MDQPTPPSVGVHSDLTSLLHFLVNMMLINYKDDCNIINTGVVEIFLEKDDTIKVFSQPSSFNPVRC